MRTAAEIFLETIKPDGRPERQLKQYEALGFTFKDPVNTYIREGQVPGSVCVDKWGTTLSFPADAPGRTPIITEDNKACPDITDWRKYVHAPDIETAAQGDWTEAAAEFDNIRAGGQLATMLMGTGIFEQCHFLMGIEDTLVNLYEHPGEMHELIDYILDYRLRYAKLIIDNLHPDVVLSHDDWGTRTALFMQPDVWREFFKEPYRKFYSYIRSQGVIVIHHADSYLVPIVEDMAEIGIQVWQGVLPENDIPALLRQLGGKMTLMGGIGAVIDGADVEEEQARSYVRKVLEECCPYGHFIPSITYGMKGTINKHIDPFIDAEIDAYNAELHFRNIAPSVAASEKSDSAEASLAAAESENAEASLAAGESGNAEASFATEESANSQASAAAKESVSSGEVGDDAVSMRQLERAAALRDISQAIQTGNRKKIVELCNRAVEAGVSASAVIDEGLIHGMKQVGAAFSEGRAFVPEMLLAARVMELALEKLRPMLKDENTGKGDKAQRKLRAVIGTIEGDLHDIGKNLVRIMFEGSGIEVTDLGSNVPCEDFIDTAIEKNCDIIACSSLLSTTMWNMKNVVDSAVERGIRDRVKIMVGGAPVTQEFCDEIGADAYTADAGEAARIALEICGM